MQFINVEIVDVDTSGAEEIICPLPAIPRVGETVVVKDTGEMDEYITFKVIDVVYYSLLASTSPRRAYITLFVEKNSRGGA